jgi:hypothetical protein
MHQKVSSVYSSSRCGLQDSICHANDTQTPARFPSLLLLLQGVGNDMVTGQTGPLAHIDLAARVGALNNLLRSSKVALFKQGTQLLYKSAQQQDNR